MGGIIIISILIGRDISVHFQFGNCPYGSRHTSPTYIYIHIHIPEKQKEEAREEKVAIGFRVSQNRKRKAERREVATGFRV